MASDENIVTKLTESEAGEIERALDSLWNVAMAGSIEIPEETKRLYRAWTVRLAIARDENGRGDEIGGASGARARGDDDGERLDSRRE